MLELSTVSSFIGILKHLSGMKWQNILLNLLTLTALWALWFLIANRVWLANLLMGIVCGIISIINYFVILYHGMPLSFLVLRNLPAAMNVLSNYTFSMDANVGKLLMLTGSVIALSFLCRYLVNDRKLSMKAIAIRDCILILCCLGIFTWGYLGPNPVKPVKTLTWTWTEPYLQYGYVPCTVESLMQSISIVNRPDGYSPEAVEDIAIPSEYSGTDATPDIILILNESFFDLRQVTDLETDRSYFPHIQAMDNLLTGYAVIPGPGGGTNGAEYELLTCNSLQLMPAVTPFNALGLTDANSIVSHLSALGYTTLAAHSEPAVNYSRGIAYPRLGFDRVYFEPDFKDVEYYYDRWFETDESLYKNLIRWYEETPSQDPRFLYLLTIQNHGPHDINPSQHDRIHVKTDFGEYTESVNEFLTCLSLSDEAFYGLTEYFRSADRPVIICMMGDHAPTLAKSIIDSDYSQEEAALRQRTVPLVIWANFPLREQSLGTMSANYVLPSLLEIGGVKLSPYYRYLLNMKSEVPIFTSYGKYYDKDGTLYSFSSASGSPYEKLVDGYLYLEYHNLQSTRNQSLYDPDP